MSQVLNAYEADINISSIGDTTLVAADANSPIRIWKLWLVVNGADNLIFKNGSTAFNAGVLDLTGAGSSIFFAYDGQPYWTTSINSGFVLNTSTTAQVTGRVYYTKG